MDNLENSAERHSDELLNLLADVNRDDPYYYGPLSPEAHESMMLRKLESLGYIRYCPYPEEFWVMLPEGRVLLQKAANISSGQLGQSHD
jgi:hypothetical protein